MAQPLVSAITIFLNGERFIREAIDSVLAQTYEQWELILVDDGSTDGSTAIAMAYAARFGDRIRYVEHDGHQNRGMSASRNLGIRHARGAYLAFLDADDVWLPGKFEHQVAQMEAAPDAAMLCSATEYWYSWSGAADAVARDHVRQLGLELDVVYDPPALSSVIYPIGQAPAPCMCSVLVRAEAMRRIGGFEDSFTGFYEDQAMLAKMYLRERVLVASGTWDRYRIHEQSCSATTSVDDYGAVRRHFLTWVARYVEMQGISDDGALRALNMALSEFHESSGDRPAERTMLSLLRLAGGNSARLLFPPGNPDALRLEIGTLESPVAYDVQISQPRLTVSAGRRYSLSFLARADTRRELSVGFAKGHAPWTNLGFYDRVDLDPAWRSFEREFEVTEDESNARIHFDAGESPVSIEISAVSLRCLHDGSVVRQTPRSSRGAVSSAFPASDDVWPGQTDFGSFRRVHPISRDFGSERGRPIDRYYIERFLESRGADVRGRVLEIGERTYTTRFGGAAVTQSDVLHVAAGDPEATIIADLADADHIPSDSFDCIILTQTLQLIYDVRAAVRTIHRILKPNGVVLATFPGISQTYDVTWGVQWYWSFTALSAKRLFGDVFGPESVEVGRHGNVLAATAFLHGLAVEEISTQELDFHDPGYDVTLTVRAVKRPAVEIGETHSEKAGRPTSLPSDSRQAAILMYHRIADASSDPWSLCVRPDRFAEHLEVLQRHTEIVSLRDAADSGRRSRKARPLIALTFDDGYADNLHAASPLLARHDVPASVFVASGYVGGTREFWWDELEAVVLTPLTLPALLELGVDGDLRRWPLADVTLTDAQKALHRTWRAPADPPTPRHQLFAELWRLLRPLQAPSQRDVLDALWQWSGHTRFVRPTHRTMTVDEVIALEAGGLVAIGAHSVTHPILPGLPAADQSREVADSRRHLETWLGKPVTSFAYPFGARDGSTRAAVEAAHIERACTTTESAIPTQIDCLDLPRFHVADWDGDEFERRLRGWLAG